MALGTVGWQGCKKFVFVSSPLPGKAPGVSGGTSTNQVKVSLGPDGEGSKLEWASVISH